MKPIPLLALFIATVAFADGVPLMAPAKAPTAADQAGQVELAKAPWVASVTPLTFNQYALDSNVITLTIEGKDYKFVGGKDAASDPTMVNGVLTKSTTDGWTGDAGPGTSASFVRDGSSVTGQIFVNGTTYGLISGALVKTKPVVGINNVFTPEMVEFHRKEPEE